MKYKVFPASGGENLEIEDLEWLQDAYKEAIEALAKIIGNPVDTYIVSGVVNNGTTVSAGWIYHDGQLLRFKESPSNSSVVIRNEEINAGEGDWEKWAECGTGVDTISFSGMLPIDTLRGLAAAVGTRVQRKTKIKVLSTLSNYTVALVREDPTTPGTYIQIAPSYNLASYEELENLCDGDVSVGKLIDIG